MRITRVLTDQAIAAPSVRARWRGARSSTCRLFGLRKRAATGNHAFDRLCDEFGIERRLAPPMRPQTLM